MQKNKQKSFLLINIKRVAIQALSLFLSVFSFLLIFATKKSLVAVKLFTLQSG